MQPPWSLTHTPTLPSPTQGFNATVMAYGQTGSGKTHTMSGGVGSAGRLESGVISGVVANILHITHGLRAALKPGEAIGGEWGAQGAARGSMAVSRGGREGRRQ